MNEALTTLVEFWGWFAGQSILVQVAVGIGVLAIAYAVWVVARVLWLALYAAFRSLG